MSVQVESFRTSHAQAVVVRTGETVESGATHALFGIVEVVAADALLADIPVIGTGLAVASRADLTCASAGMMVAVDATGTRSTVEARFAS